VLLASLAAAIAGCTRASSPRPSTPPDRWPEGRAPGNEAHAWAESLAGVRFTAADRRQAFDAIEGQVALIRARQAYRPHNHFPPATRFDPRLPGTIVPQVTRYEPIAVDPGPLPDDTDAIAFATVPQLSAWIRSGALSSARLTELYLERLRSVDAALECVVTLTPELARAQAERADEALARGRWLGPLHGIPWGAKDLLDTQGIKTTWGATPYRDRVPDRDATVVRRLESAGAVMIGKLSLGALAYGDVWYGGTTKNPWNLEEGSSGSSAGSASAVVAGAVGFALGTETLGSIVSPSTRCGATGLRPTFGRVSRAGAMAVAWTLDKVGPICRSSAGTMAVLQALDGHDPRDPSTTGVALSYQPTTDPLDRSVMEGLRVGYDPAWFEGAFSHERAVLGALRSAGVKLEKIELPDRPYNALLLNLYAEAAAAFEEITMDDLDDSMVWQDREAWPNTLRMSRFIPAVDFVQVDRLRRQVMIDFSRVFERVHALVSPSFAGPLLVATNYTGHPSLTLPVGFHALSARSIFGEPDETKAKADVPLGITLWGRLYREDLLVHLGRALEVSLATKLGGLPGRRRRPIL
jgi:Asp-tRNA(Asn)/Glu-tRNA(Gln) amidotransferase A subunit family amidase